MTEEQKYDSTKDTLLHIKEVSQRLITVVQDLLSRASCHDTSKLVSPEKEIFDVETPKLKELQYGSEEYKESLNRLMPALKHHYANNSHHPEHYENGIQDMNLLDIIEMLVDWKAASLRSKDGSMEQSIEISCKRFNIDPQLKAILINTAMYMEWDK